MNDEFQNDGAATIRMLVQAVCVIAIALGAGLWGFGSYLRPDVNGANPAEVVAQFNRPEEIHWFSASASGAGVGFITLGGLGLIVPWINVLVHRQQQPSEPPVAGQISASA